MRTMLRVLLVTSALLAVTAGCTKKETPVSPSGEGQGPGDGAGGRPLAAPEPTPGIYFRLSDAGAGGAEDAAAVTPAEAAPLSGAELAAILGRLPAMPEGSSVQADFALQPGPKPPAVAGETRPQAFPPVDERGDPPPSVEAGPLTVLRFGPEGELDSAPRLSITFSKAMVPLTSQAALAAAEVPVTLEPQPAGLWRWVGTRTLIFEPEGERFPKATDYTVTAPAGLKAADGEALAEAVSWRFGTPPVSLSVFHPDDYPPADRLPLLFLGFDQAVSVEALLPFVELRAAGQSFGLRPATPAEIADDREVAGLVEDWSAAPRADRWIVLRPERELPLGAKAELRLAKGLPSAEGPRTTSRVQNRDFEVYGPLRVTRISCSGDDYQEKVLREDTRRASLGKCAPFGYWSIELSNPLALETVDAEAIDIEPALPGRRVTVGEGSIQIGGASAGRSRYTVTLPGDIQDVHGQRLEEGFALRFETGDMRPALAVPGDEMQLLDPDAGGKLQVYSINNDGLRASLYRVGPEDWSAYQIARNAIAAEQPLDPPGERVWQGDLRPKGDRDAVATAQLDLAPGLDAEGHGQLIAVIEPAKWSPRDENWSNRPQWRWVQVSALGLDAFGEAEGVTARVTDLADGAPRAEVDLELYRLPRIAWRGGETLASAPVSAARGRTDRDGLALLAVPAVTDGEPSETMLVARAGGDTAMLPYGVLGWRAGGEQLAWQVFDDRGLYKPGEVASVKGWVRRLDLGKGGDVGALEDWPERIDWSLRAPNGEEAGSGSFAVTPLGGFAGQVPIPEGSELGEAWLQLRAVGGRLPADGRESGLGLQIAEFRRPEFEVTTRLDEPSLIFGDTARVTAKAEYYAGGPLPGAEVDWMVRAEPSAYSPPGHDDFVFGTWRPGWGFWEQPGGQGGEQSHQGRTDAVGEHGLAVALEGAVPVGPASFLAQATVMDVNRQAWTSSTSFLVHPARDYVGLRLDRWFTDPGQPITVEAIVADIDGALVSGRAIELVAERVEGRWQGERWVEETLPAGDCSLTSAEEPVACALRFETGGMYRLTAEVADAQGRPNMSQLTLWVSGGAPSLPRGDGLEEASVTLIPDADSYQPGDTARVLVQAPFAPAAGLWSLRRSGLVERRAFQIDESGSAVLEIPITEDYLPGIQLQVDLTGRAPRAGAAPDAQLPPRPAYASGQLKLEVPPESRRLKVEALAREAAIAPGGKTTVDIRVRDAEGRPLADAELALIVVDEAVLALTGHDIGDPMAAFYPERDPGVRDERLRRWLQLADPGLIGAAGNLANSGRQDRMGAEPMSGALPPGASLDPGAAEMEMAADAADESAGADRMYSMAATPGLPPPLTGGGAEPPTIVERSNLDPLAAFLPDLRTDGEGKLAAEITLPDTVTRYRIWAVASDGGARFGKADSSLTARLPLIVRPSAPRFLNFGDRFELPVVVQNQTDADLEVSVVVRAANLDLGAGPGAGTGTADEASADAEAPAAAPDAAGAADLATAGLRATIPAGDRRELRFPAAARLPGTAAFQAVVVSGDLSDAQRVTLPVWTPATTEAFATYGEIDAGAIAQPVERPPEVVAGFGGLELTTSSTALSALTDAFLYLDSYPFEHEEATASRLLASVALVDVLEAFGAEGMPDRPTVEARIAADIDRLAGRQNGDGGWGWWPSEGRSAPFGSLHVMHALARASAKDYPVPEETLARGRDYLQAVDDHASAFDYAADVRLGLRAYALYVRALTGDLDATEARALYAERDRLGIDGEAWLLTVMAGGEGFDAERTELRRALGNAAIEEAGTAQITTGYEETASALLLASDRRTDALAVEALMADQPESDLIPKLVRGLLAHRVKGRWGSTQECAWVLLALDGYFRAYEAETPSFEASAWLGADFLGRSRFEGRSPDRALTEVPMAFLPADAPADLVLSKTGPGRLYYRLGLRYAPSDLDLAPLERGFSVERRYEAVDDPDDVRRTADGGWEVKAGARVRVRLGLVAPARRYHVALVDPLPAGLEALNPELATTGELPRDPADLEVEDGGFDGWPWWRWWTWYEHEAFRDARVEVFSSLLWDGVYDYSYIARATTPGDFVVPPAKAEELFQPETFGRSGSDRLRVVLP
ncbi:MAG: Ig-like domain-containing protein [Caldilineae bacterium]|nr:Ig-like domain-containing protein [Caldilineae bacterium]